jgi:fermentation-respiration switch protein FrsA (DUF1100 family)
MVEYARTVLGHAKVTVMAMSTGAAAAIQSASRNSSPGMPGFANALVLESAFLSRQHLFRHLVCSMFGLYTPVLGAFFYLFRFLAVAVTQTVVLLNDKHLVLDPFECMSQINPQAVMFLHPANDAIVPLEHSCVLFTMAPCVKELWISPNARHTGMFHANPAAWEAK